MKIEKIIKLFKEHNDTGKSIRRLTNDKHTEHELLKELLTWAEGAVEQQRGFSWLTQRIYSANRHYKKEWERTKDTTDRYFYEGMAVETLISDIEHEYPWVREEEYLDEVGGFHSPGDCYNPEGHYCGECNRESCKGCAYEEKEKEFAW